MLRALHPSLRKGPLELDREESHHLVRVRRAGAGMPVALHDGAGAVGYGTLTTPDAKRARVEVERIETVPAPRHPLWLLQALPKGKGMDGIVQRATELGVARILPLFTAHGEVRLDAARAEHKTGKWRTLADEAIKQCGNPWRPRIDLPRPFDGVLDEVASVGSGLVAALRPPVRPVREAVKATIDAAAGRPLLVAVGPEGDFSPQEYDRLAAAGWQSVTLGPLVLRVETASCALLALALDALRETLES
ncbi:MAG: RsmE family RNA methyltransferase [Opitutales bacterium]